MQVPGEMFELAMAAKRERGMGVVGSTQNILDFIAVKLSAALEQPFGDKCTAFLCVRVPCYSSPALVHTKKMSCTTATKGKTLPSCTTVATIRCRLSFVSRPCSCQKMSCTTPTKGRALPSCTTVATIRCRNNSQQLECIVNTADASLPCSAAGCSLCWARSRA